MRNHIHLKEAISSGAIGMLYDSKNPDSPEEPLFTIRVHSSNQKIRFDLDFWEKISSNPLKPCSIPNFYGSFLDDSGDLHTYSTISPKV